jgi:hypothetical protein
MEASQKTKNCCMIQQYRFSGYTQRNVNQDTIKTLAALLTIAKLWKQPQCPTTDEWIKKTPYIMEFYSAIRKNETMWFKGKRMQLEDIMLSEVSQAQ